jgi:hypothetical protein
MAAPPPIQAAAVVVEAPRALVALPVAAFDDPSPARLAPVVVTETPHVQLPDAVFDVDLPFQAAPTPQPDYAPRAADAPVVHSTPDAFTPADAASPQARRVLVAIVLGLAAAMLLLVGFLAVRSLVGGSGTKTTAATVAPTGEASANAMASATAEADQPKQEPKPETPPAESATATATEAPAATEEPPTTATPSAAGAGPAAAAPAAVVAGPADAQGAPGAAKPPPSLPKKRTYEPLGI